MPDGTVQAALPGTDNSSSSVPAVSSDTQPTTPLADIPSTSADLNNTNDALTNFSRTIIQSAGRQGANINDILDKYQTTHEQFNNALTGFVNNVDTARKTIGDAQTNILASKNVPNFVANIMGLFGDHRFQKDYQSEIIQGATKDLQLQNEKVNTLANLDQANKSALEVARSGQQTALATGLEIAQNQRANISTQLQLKNQQFIDAQHLVDGMSVPQLQNALQNPETVSTKNPQVTPGMIQETLQRKQTSAIALQHAGVILDQAKTNLTASQLSLTQELINRSITNMSSQDLQRYQEEAKNGDGYVNLSVPGDKENHTVRIPGNTFTMAIAARQEAMNKYIESNKPVDLARAENPVLAKEITDRSNAYSNNPYITPYVDPVKVAELGRTIGMANNLAQANPLAANELYNKAKAILDDFQKTSIDSAKPEEKTGLKQYFNTGGRIDDSTAASDLLLSSVKNAGASPLPLGDPYAVGDSVARKAFEQASYMTKQAIPGAGNGSIGGGSLLNNLVKTPPSDQQVFEHMLAGDQGRLIKNAIVGSLQNRALYGIVRDLATDYPDRTGIQAFKNVMQNGDWADSVKGPDGGLDTTKLYQQLATDPKNMDVLISRLNNQDVRRGFAINDSKIANTPLHAAYRQRLFNNDVTSIFVPMVQVASQYYNKAIQNAQVQSALAAQQIAAAIKNNEITQQFDAGRAGPIGQTARNIQSGQGAGLAAGPPDVSSGDNSGPNLMDILQQFNLPATKSPQNLSPADMQEIIKQIAPYLPRTVGPGPGGG